MSNRDEYIDKAAERLKEWSAKVDEMQAKAADAAGTAKAEMEAKLKELYERRDEARYMLNRMQAAGEDAWQDARGHVDTALGELKNAAEAAFKRFF